MDPKKLHSLIESVAEVEYIKPKRLATVKQSRTEVSEVLYNNKPVEISLDYNPSLGIKLKKFKSEAKPCELGCGKQIKNQVIEQRLHDIPHPHWRKKCANCKKYQAPDGTIIENSTHVHAYFLKYFNNINK